MVYWAVFFGGGVGSVLRFVVSGWVYSRLDFSLPWGTLAVNVLGSFVIGVFSELFSSYLSVSPEVRMGLLVGLLGGFTTFSSFAMETVSLLRDGEFGYAVGNVVLNNALAILFAFLGLALTREMVVWIRGWV